MVKSLVLAFLTHGVDAFCGIPDTHKSISIRALPRTPHGELTPLASSPLHLPFSLAPSQFRQLFFISAQHVSRPTTVAAPRAVPVQAGGCTCDSERLILPLTTDVSPVRATSRRRQTDARQETAATHLSILCLRAIPTGAALSNYSPLRPAKTAGKLGCLLKIDITSVTDANENEYTSRRYIVFWQ